MGADLKHYFEEIDNIIQSFIVPLCDSRRKWLLNTIEGIEFSFSFLFALKCLSAVLHLFLLVGPCSKIHVVVLIIYFLYGENIPSSFFYCHSL